MTLRYPNQPYVYSCFTHELVSVRWTVSYNASAVAGAHDTISRRRIRLCHGITVDRSHKHIPTHSQDKWLLFCCVFLWFIFHVGTYMSHLVVSITVYMLAQSPGSSYMHVIARLCRMCYEVLRAHACSACAHASQLHSHSKLHSLQTLLYKCFSNQVDVKGHGIANLFSTIHNNSSHKHTASNTANASSTLTDQSTIGRSTTKTSTSIVSFSISLP